MGIRSCIRFFVIAILAVAFTVTEAAEIGGVVKDKETGRGIARVVVQATPIQPGARKYEALTDRSGNYVIKVPRGQYRITAVPTGTNYLPGFYSLPDTPKVPGMVEVVAEDVFAFANVTLELGGSIEGRISRLSDGIALENVRVTAEAQSFRAVTTTDRNGRYTLHSLPPDAYTIQAGILDSNYIPIYYPRTVFAGQAERISIAPGTKASGINLKLEFGATIKGRILSASTNQPLQDIMTIAVPMEGNQPERFAYTDRQGIFSIHGLGRGRYVIEAGDERSEQPEGTKQHQFVTQFFDNEFDRELAKPVTVSGAETITGIDFTLFRGNRIRGRVRSFFYNQPMADVVIRPALSPETKARIPTSVSSADGDYLVEGLPPGNFRVTVDLPVSHEAYVPTWYRDQVVEKKGTVLTLRDGDTYPGVDFNLRLGGRISGQVSVDDPEYALEFKRLHLVLATVNNEIDGFEPRAYDLSEGGRYSIVGAPAGRFHLSVSSEDPNLVLGSPSDEKTVIVTEGRELRDVDFPLRVGGSISGKIILKRSHLPLERYRLLLLRIGEPFYEFYKIQGDHYTMPGLRAGKYIVVLVEEQEPMTLEKLFTGSRFYDSRIVEVKKGVEVGNVDFFILEGQSLTAP